MSAPGDVTNQRRHLALLVHGDAAVLLSRTVEPADGGAFKGADGSDLGSFQRLVPSAGTQFEPGNARHSPGRLDLGQGRA